MKNFRHKFGEWAIVTGATSKMGKAFARQLAEQGVNLILFGRRAFLLKEIAVNLKAINKIKVKYAVLDAVKDNFIEKIEQTIEGIEVRLLVSSAEVISKGKFLNNEASQATTTVHLNATTQTKISEWFANRLIAKGQEGGIALLSSDLADESHASTNTTQSSSCYILNLGKSLNYDLQDQGIHVTVALQDPNDVPCLMKMTNNNLNKNRLLKPRPVEALAKESLAALYKNKPLHIGGAKNKITLKTLGVLSSISKTAVFLGNRVKRVFFTKKEAL